MPRGNVRVSISADNDGLKRGLKDSEQQLGRFHGRVTQSFGAVRGSIVGASAALLGGAGLVEGIKATIEANNRAEVSQKKLIAQLHASNISYREHAKEIDKVIQKTSQLSGLDDEDLQDAFTNIVRVTGSVSESLKQVGLVADFARAKHLDVAKAGEIVGKVMGGNVGVLTRYGLSVKPVTAATDALAKSHDKVTVEQRRQAAQADKTATANRALGVLQQKFAGQAANYGKTTSGAIDRAKVAVENLQETIGAKLAPTVAKGANAVAKFVTQMQTGTGAGGRFVDTLRRIYNQVSPIIQQLIGAGVAVGKFAGHHPELLKVAAAFVAVNTALRALKFTAAITGFSKLLTAGRVAGTGLKTILGRAGTEAGEAAATNAAAGMGSKVGRFNAIGRLAGSAWGIGFAITAGIEFGKLLVKLRGDTSGPGAAAIINAAGPTAGNQKPGQSTGHTGTGAGGLGRPGDRTVPGAKPNPNPKITPGKGGARAVNTRSLGAAGTFNRVRGRAASVGGGRARAASGGGSFSLQQLANLWVQAGGDPSIAGLMAHVAMAESGGNPRAYNPSGASGLWQILGQPFAGDVFDPLTNARMAVWKYEHQGLGAWAASRGVWGKYVGNPGVSANGGSTGTAGGGRTGATSAHEQRLRNQRAEDRAVSPYDQRIASADVAIADAQGSGKGDRPDLANALRGKRRIIGARIRTIRAALKKRGLRKTTRLRLTQELASLKAEHTDLGQQIKDALPSSIDAPEDTGTGPAVAEVPGTGTDDNTAALNALNDTISQLNAKLDLQAQANAELQRNLNTSQSEYGQFKQWLAGVVSGEVGGRIGLGFFTPGFSGGGSRY